jgi:CRP-like cAMP-binding protein
MRTIVPLRIFGIFGDISFIGYGVLANSVTTFFLYLLLLPINSVRLYQMLKLVKKARLSAQGDLSMSWLEPYMARRKYRAKDVLFRKAEPANEMFMAVTGKFLVSELGMELPPGQVFGELGFLSPKNRRTQTVECVESGEVLTITYDKLLELYFQNPEFGYYFLRLTSERLLQNMKRLEDIVEQNKDVIEQNRTKLHPETAKDA